MRNFRNCRFLDTVVPGIFQRLFTATQLNPVLKNEYETFDEGFLASETIFNKSGELQIFAT